MFCVHVVCHVFKCLLTTKHPMLTSDAATSAVFKQRTKPRTAGNLCFSTCFFFSLCVVFISVSWIISTNTFYLIKTPLNQRSRIDYITLYSSLSRCWFGFNEFICNAALFSTWENEIAWYSNSLKFHRERVSVSTSNALSGMNRVVNSV